MRQAEGKGVTRRKGQEAAAPKTGDLILERLPAIVNGANAKVRSANWGGEKGVRDRS